MREKCSGIVSNTGELSRQLRAVQHLIGFGFCKAGHPPDLLRKRDDPFLDRSGFWFL
jgi:hypothetical protein